MCSRLDFVNYFEIKLWITIKQPLYEVDVNKSANAMVLKNFNSIDENYANTTDDNMIGISIYLVFITSI